MRGTEIYEKMKNNRLFLNLSLEIFRELNEKLDETEELSVEDMIRESNLKEFLDPDYVEKLRKLDKDDLDIFYWPIDYYIGLKKFVKGRYENVDVGMLSPGLKIIAVVKKPEGIIHPLKECYGTIPDADLFAYMEVKGIAKRKTK